MLYRAVMGGNIEAHDTLRAEDLTNKPEMVKVLAGPGRLSLAATPSKVSAKMAMLLSESERRTDTLNRAHTRAVSSFE